MTNADRFVYLDEADVLAIHEGLVAFFSEGDDPIEPSGPRNETLVGSAVSRPRTSLGNVDKYATLESKAAAFMHSLILNHAFHNGNKRTALVATLSFLERNGRRLSNHVADDEIFSLLTELAGNQWPTANTAVDDVVAELAQWFRSRITVQVRGVSSMRVGGFLSRCRQAGLRVIEKNGEWKIQGRTTVGFLKSTRELDGSVVKVYLRKLGITEQQTGISLNAFQEGVEDSDSLLLRFKSLLQRLAHA